MSGHDIIRFECDYGEGAHPRILEALLKTNIEQTRGYGEDIHCETARRIIRIACGREDMDVHFLVGGTQANTTVIASALRHYQAVVCADTGHIATHETGAIEAAGHKVITIPTEDGKVNARQVRRLADNHRNDPSHEHMPQPAMLYISQPTETGLLYSRNELRELRQACDSEEMFLYVDGARLGYALASEQNDAFMADLAKLAHVFTIGGTKVGAMFGEAVCICDDRLRKDFRYNMKQRGAMLAKGRFLGIQFETLLKDGLYIEISRNAVAQAMKLKEAFVSHGCPLLYDSPTNQQFPIVSQRIFTELGRHFSMMVWEKLPEDKLALRVTTSWATRDDDVESFIAEIKRVCRLYGEKPSSAAEAAAAVLEGLPGLGR